MNDFVFNVLSDFAANLLIAAIGIGLYLSNRGRKRARLFRFFGVSSRRGVQIVLSRMEIKEGGTKAVEGQPLTAGYSGPSVNYIEYQAALECQKLFRFRFFSWLSQSFLSGVAFTLRDIRAAIEISPYSREKIPPNDPDNLVLVGNHIYNVFSLLYQQQDRNLNYHFERIDTQRVVTFYASPQATESEIQLGRPSRELGTIQRIIDQEGRRVFICAGTGSAATCASLLYLTRHWEAFYRAAGSDLPFSLLLAFPTLPQDIPDVEALQMLLDRGHTGSNPGYQLVRFLVNHLPPANPPPALNPVTSR